MTDYVELAKALFPMEQSDPDYGRELPWGVDYQPIINHFGTIAVQVDDSDYQGDTRVLYADTGKGFGYLNFGWGSCSGCDALEACNSYTEAADLIRDLESSIKWASKEEMLTFFKTHDWEGDYSWHAEEQKQFVDQTIAFLEA